MLGLQRSTRTSLERCCRSSLRPPRRGHVPWHLPCSSRPMGFRMHDGNTTPLLRHRGDMGQVLPTLPQARIVLQVLSAPIPTYHKACRLHRSGVRAVAGVIPSLPAEANNLHLLEASYRSRASYRLAPRIFCALLGASVVLSSPVFSLLRGSPACRSSHLFRRTLVAGIYRILHIRKSTYR